MTLVWFLDLKFLCDARCKTIGTSNAPHYQLYDSRAVLDLKFLNELLDTMIRNFKSTAPSAPLYNPPSRIGGWKARPVSQGK
jgi:hypothetical protein